jgi:hypothetical protein
MSSGFSQQLGFINETTDLPSEVNLDDVTIPEYMTESGYVAEYRGNAGDLYQESHSAGEGLYQLNYLNETGLGEVATQLNPAAGSANLIEPRNAHGIPGTNRVIHSTGPVTGTPDNWYSGQRTATQAQPVGLNGPVVGGADTGHGTSNAYYAAQNAMYSQAAAEAGLMAAI